MTKIDLRGGCSGMPLEMTGEWTGYNNGATMQVGLWIRNDGEHIGTARAAALEGPQALRECLTGLMTFAVPYAPAAHQAGQAAGRSKGGWSSIDWAQITYDLVGSEPDDDEIAAAAKDIAEALEEFGVEDDTPWELAVRRREAVAREIAMRGVE